MELPDFLPSMSSHIESPPCKLPTIPISHPTSASYWINTSTRGPITTEIPVSIANNDARQSLIVRGLFLMLADPRQLAEVTKSFVAYWQAEEKNASNESILKVALDYGKACDVIKPRDRVVVCQKVGDDSIVKIIELQD